MKMKVYVWECELNGKTGVISSSYPNLTAAKKAVSKKYKCKCITDISKRRRITDGESVAYLVYRSK